MPCPCVDLGQNHFVGGMTGPAASVLKASSHVKHDELTSAPSRNGGSHWTTHSMRCPERAICTPTPAKPRKS